MRTAWFMGRQVALLGVASTLACAPTASREAVAAYEKERRLDRRSHHEIDTCTYKDRALICAIVTVDTCLVTPKTPAQMNTTVSGPREERGRKPIHQGGIAHLVFTLTYGTDGRISGSGKKIEGRFVGLGKVKFGLNAALKIPAGRGDWGLIVQPRLEIRHRFTPPASAFVEGARSKQDLERFRDRFEESAEWKRLEPRYSEIAAHEKTKSDPVAADAGSAVAGQYRGIALGMTKSEALSVGRQTCDSPRSGGQRCCLAALQRHERPHKAVFIAGRLEHLEIAFQPSWEANFNVEVARHIELFGAPTRTLADKIPIGPYADQYLRTSILRRSALTFTLMCRALTPTGTCRAYSALLAGEDAAKVEQVLIDYGE